jgi:hypothetical protein
MMVLASDQEVWRQSAPRQIRRYSTAVLQRSTRGSCIGKIAKPRKVYIYHFKIITTIFTIIRYTFESFIKCSLFANTAISFFSSKEATS